jgi:DNA repair exonuclease SbcCD nuclease subunit
MELLVVGDCHFKVSNVREMTEFCTNLVSLVKEKKYKTVIMMGDTLDTHEKVHLKPLCMATDLIKKLATLASVYLLIGNHDRINNNDFLSDIHPFSSLVNTSDNIHIIDKPSVFKIGNHNIMMVPYVYPGRFMEAINTIRKDDLFYFKGEEKGIRLNDIHCIFAHQEFYNCKLGATVSTIGDKWETNQPMVISGHIHEYDHLQSNIL